MTINIEYEAEKKLNLPYESIIEMWLTPHWIMKNAPTRQRSMSY